MGDSKRQEQAVIRRRRLRSASPCALAAGVRGVLNPTGLVWVLFPKEFSLGLQPVPPATRKDHKTRKG
eukprot:8410821-Pyramimonas_sp.AAC.1